MIKELFQENKTTIQNFCKIFYRSKDICEYFKSYWADDKNAIFIVLIFTLMLSQNKNTQYASRGKRNCIRSL